MNGLTQVIPEREHHKKALKTLDDARMVVHHEKNVTQVIFHSDQGVVGGWAKRNPNYDELSPERGIRIATIRAYRAFRANKNRWL